MKMKTGCAFMHDRLNEYVVASLNVDASPIVCQQHVLWFQESYLLHTKKDWGLMRQVKHEC